MLPLKPCYNSHIKLFWTSPFRSERYHNGSRYAVSSTIPTCRLHERFDALWLEHANLGISPTLLWSEYGHSVHKTAKECALLGLAKHLCDTQGCWPPLKINVFDSERGGAEHIGRTLCSKLTGKLHEIAGLRGIDLNT